MSRTDTASLSPLPTRARMDTIELTELLGDGIGPELAAAVHRVAEALPTEFRFRPIDWSVETREATGPAAIDAAVESMQSTRLALKYPTQTATQSPNALLRRRCEFSVIYRPVLTIPGISGHFKAPLNLHVVRVATGGTYDDPGQVIGRDTAVSIRMVEREPVAQAASFAFELARRRGFKVTSSSKHTIQRYTDGLFESVVRDVHGDFADVTLDHELFDALLGKIILTPEKYQVVLVLNEYGDFLSDMASGLVGSLGTGASGNFAFDAERKVTMAMFDPAGGTAPDIAGQDKANPTAMLLAFGMLLDHVDRYDLGHAVRLAMLGAIADGECTADIGGKLRCSEFTQVVVDRIPAHLPK